MQLCMDWKSSDDHLSSHPFFPSLARALGRQEINKGEIFGCQGLNSHPQPQLNPFSLSNTERHRLRYFSVWADAWPSIKSAMWAIAWRYREWKGVCELAQAGRRNHHETMDEMQRVHLFPLPREPGDPWSSTQVEAHKRGCRHHRDQSLLEDRWTCWFCLFFRDSGKSSLPLCFDLSHSRAGISSMFHRVPLSLSHACVIWTQKFYLSNTHGQTTSSTIYVFFYTSAASHLSVFTVLLANLLLFS